MLDTIWDAFLSFSIRGVFTFALAAGLNAAIWAYQDMRANPDDPDAARIGLFLFSLLAVVGAAGVFRRGRAERNFSVIPLAGVAAGLAIGHVHLHDAKGRGRVLRRWPAAESVVLGSLLIGLWLLVWIRREQVWFLRNAAIVGAVQILWGLTLGRKKIERRNAIG